VARQARRPFFDGIQFVDLAAVATSELVPNALLTLLRAQPLGDEEPLDTIVRVLRPLRLLLILDNAEHVREGVRTLVRAVLAACRSVHVLVTSREALELAGEQRISVPPLPVPSNDRDDPDYVGRFEGVQLFLERARRVDRAFRLDAGNSATVGRLCRALDGIPLALELAAARLAVDAIDELVSDERSIVTRLTGADPDDRRSSLFHSLEWSLAQLSAQERALFDALSAFAAPFTREQMLGLAHDRATANESLDHLVRCAIVARDPDSVRFRLLATSRDYVERHTDEATRAQRRERHARLMLDRAREVGPIFRTSRQQYACDLLRSEFSDYRQAMHWFLNHRMIDEGAALLVELFQFGFNNAIAEVNEWAVETSTLIIDQHPLASEVCGAAAMAWWSRGETDEAVDLGERAVRCASSTVGASTIWARTALQNAFAYAGRMAEAVPNHLAQVEELRRSTDPYWNLLGLGFEAISLMMVGRPERARDRVDRALALARKTRNPECQHWALYCLGRLLEPTDPPAASAAFEEAMDAARSVESRLYLGFDLLEWVALRRRLEDLPNAIVGLLELMDILHSSGNSSQLSQLYTEVAQVLAESGQVAEGVVVFLARAGLPHMPKGAHSAEPDTAVGDRLRDLAGSAWPVLEVRAAAMTDEVLMTFARQHLEAVLRQRAAA
jgi:predicted ATPase